MSFNFFKNKGEFMHPHEIIPATINGTFKNLKLKLLS